jgi:hypothetical protein
MNTLFKTRFWRMGRWFAALLGLMLALRLVYGYLEPGRGGSDFFGSDFFSSLGSLRKNYASEKFAGKGGSDAQAQANLAVNQKFEKTALVRTKSSEFEQDEKSMNAQVNKYGAVVQYEQRLGQKGARQLHLVIGVRPSAFDSFYVDIQKTGTVLESQVTKVDKTNEYRQLNAQKTSLEKTLQSLNELKAKGGQIADYVVLNDKILEIEGRLQELGVELGNFDTENEFCTVRFSLYEGATARSISFAQRLKVALEWTIKYYALLVFTLLMLALAMFVLLFVADKWKVVSAVREKLDE